jgi:hypothetical protein
MSYRTLARQRGISLTSLIFSVIVVAAVAVLGMKIVPTATEYFSIKKAIVSAKNAGSTEREIRNAFDKHANAGYIDSIKGADLDIQRVNNALEVSFAYEKKIPLFGPANLLIEYEGSTAKSYQKKDAKR